MKVRHVRVVRNVRIVLFAAVAVAGSISVSAQTWNSPGVAGGDQKLFQPAPGPAPRRDLSGLWDAGGAGIGARGQVTSPLTPAGEAVGRTHKSGDGIRMVPVADINDPLSTMCDPAGFPRNLLFELRPFQVVQTANQVLMLYMFERRWRQIWTDGRALPTNPDPRWYGYSVGRWEDDYTFVVNTIGLDDRTWLDNAGNPHSADMRVEERYRRVAGDTLELTVTIDDPTFYTKPWAGRDKLPLKLLRPDTDLMEMMCSATEAAEYRKIIANPSK